MDDTIKPFFLKDVYIGNGVVKAKCNSSTRSQINLLPIPLFVQLLFPLQPIQHLPFTEATAIWTIKQQLWATTDFQSGDDIHLSISHNILQSQTNLSHVPFMRCLTVGQYIRIPCLYCVQIGFIFPQLKVLLPPKIFKEEKSLLNFLWTGQCK